MSTVSKTNFQAFLSLLILVIFFTSCRDNSASKNSNPDQTNNNQAVVNDDHYSEESKEDTQSNNWESASDCDLSAPDMDSFLNTSTAELSGWPYSQEKKTDCSGMFHHLLNKLREICPDAILPEINEARSSRAIAKWYHDQGNLKIIRNAKKNGDLIKPGMVMFFGYGNQLENYDYDKIDINLLVTRGKGINHVAVVTEVTKDEQGNVVSYKMFHGRRPGKPSGITSSERDPRKTELPAYGNWKEPWLGVSDIISKR